jgi:hypothetical protein
VAAFFFAAIPAPAKAEVGAVVSAFSDDRYRGLSISDGRPVGILDLSYDGSDGLYATLSGSVVATRSEGLKGLGVVLNGGYAMPLRPGLSLDGGVVYYRFSHYSGVGSGRDYAEVYAGLTGKFLSARISLSPNYLGAIRWALHGEVDGHLDLSRKTYLDGEVGALVPLGRNVYEGGYRPQLDGRLGIANRLGPVTLHAALTGRTGSAAVYGLRGHRRAAIVLGISTAL